MRTHDEAPEAIDTAVVMDNVQVTAIKQGLTLRNRPVAASVVGRETIERRGVTAIKELSQLVPNFYIPDYGSRMTSSVYVRGLGARIDQPVMGLNVDNVPYLSKDDYDFDLADIERIEVLRGPQSTLYGHNTMGGVMNIYTLSPLAYQGTRLGAEYASGNTLRLRASTYHRPSPRTGVSLAARFMHGDGFFTNEYTGRTCDWERSGGARMRLQFRPDERWSIDNTLAFGMLRQGGYPYASAATGRIAYNDPCGYRRTTLNDGLTIRYAADGWEIASITSYQYSDDRMTLDQDFLPESYFTLTQAKQDHGLTEDIVVRSRGEGRYGWLVGAFGFYRHRSMQAPVLFKEDGLERLIADKAEQYTGLRPHFASDRMALDSDFRNPTWGAALYHESQFRLGRGCASTTSAHVCAISVRPTSTARSATDASRPSPNGARCTSRSCSCFPKRRPSTASTTAIRSTHRSPRVTRRADSTPRCSPKCCRTASWNAWASTGTVTTTSTAW